MTVVRRRRFAEIWIWPGLALGAVTLPLDAIAQDSTYDSGIAAAEATATSKRDFGGVWVTRFFEPRFSDAPPLKAEAILVQQQYSPAKDPGAKCLPSGWPRIMATPYPVEFIQTPTMTLMFFEGGGYMRRIWTDGRPHPEDMDPTWYGHSIGWWEGDTFVVDTVGTNDKNFISSAGEPKTEALHTVERWALLEGDRRLQLDITFEDPGVFTETWSSTRIFDKTADEIMEYFCENNRNDPDDPEGFNYDGVAPFEAYKGLPGSDR
jgi:hypothetical protein